MFTQILKVFESFLSKAVEWTADNALTNLKDIMDFKPILETLQNNFKSLSAKARDIDEEIKNAELSGRKKRKRQVEEWLEQVKSIESQVGELMSGVESQGFIVRLMNGGTTEKLNEQVVKLVEQSQNFGELVLDDCGTSGVKFLTNGLVGEAFNENLERVLELLEARKVSSIGIYGMGGVGKTTLAKHICNRLRQQSQRDVFWVTVSQEFTVKSLQDKIAHQLGVKLLDEDEEDTRAAKLDGALSEKKNSVLILDDVWEHIDMSKVGCSFTVECCRLIVTTRSLKVCHQIGCQEIVQVEILRDDEAWVLFIETLGKEIQLGPQVEEIAKSLANMCSGLPLGIVTVAGSMKGETSIRTWRNAKLELKECLEGKDGMGEVDVVFKVLRYSFNRLNRNHEEFNDFQQCFLYCSVYPEDLEVRREDVVRNLISDGFLDGRKSRRAQFDQGYSILDKLVKVCLLESCVYYCEAECVKMHDLVRGMALKIGEGKYMVRAGNLSLTEIPDEEEWTKGLEKVSLINNGIRRIGDGISPDCPKLSTLYLRWNPLEAIPHSFFSKMQGLCTLDLCGTHITTLPDSICDMKSLKALLLQSCRSLEKLPNLGCLKALRELDLSHTAITEAPQGVEELLNLKFLTMDAPHLKMIRSGLLLKLGHLQHVEFPFHIHVPTEEIKNLKMVEEFRGAMENVKGFNWFITSPVAHDTCYTIEIGPRDTTECYGIGVRYSPRPYNKELILWGCNLEDEKVLWQGIVYLTMNKCEGLSICLLDDFADDFARLNNPTSLKILKITSCKGIECIWRNEQPLPSQFSNTVETIELMDLDDLKAVIGRGEIGITSAAPTQAVFSSLKKLKISCCNKMRKAGLLVLGVPNIEEIEIEDCEELEEIFQDEGRGSLTLPRLRKLTLKGLPRLRKVGLPAFGVSNLEFIYITNCGEIEEIFEDDGRGSVTFPKLEDLILEELPRLKDVCKAPLIRNL